MTHDTVEEEIFIDALRRSEIEAMRAWAKNLRRRSHEVKTLLGTSPEQRKWSISSGRREAEASSPMGDVRPVPGGSGAASLLGRSPEQRNRSMPSSIREPDGSGWLRLPPYGRRPACPWCQ